MPDVECRPGGEKKLAKISPGPEMCRGCHCFTPARVAPIILIEYGDAPESHHPATALQDDQDMKRISIDRLMQAMKPAEKWKNLEEKRSTGEMKPRR